MLRKKTVILFNKLIPSFVLFGILISWEIIVKLNDIKTYILPSPSDIIKEFIQSFSLLMSHAAITLFETLLGFIIGILLAIMLSLLIDKFLLMKRIAYPYLVLSQTIPLVALAPILAIWFGFGIIPKIILVVLVVFFPITLSLTEGLSNYDRELNEMMIQLGATNKQIFFKLKMPSALTHFFSGLKIAAAYCVMGAVISEWVGAQKGLGIYLTRAMSSFQTAALFADVFIIMTISIILFKGIEYLEKKALKWRI